MNENLNLTEILKECPKGIKLYSPIFGDVYLDKIRPYSAVIVTINKEQDGFKEEFLYDGRYGINGECMIFPSKEQRDWSKWHMPFVDGDVVMCGDDQFAIFKQYINHLENGGEIIRYYIYYDAEDNCLDTVDGQCYMERLATEEEKAELFQVIKDNGYNWDMETKTLEKLKKEKFDPKTLQPFDKVLGRDFNNQNWMACLFSHIDNNFNHKFRAIDRAGWYHCIPFNDDTKHLVGKSDEAPEFYRYWED